jgi:hypothetical protein
MNPTGHELWPNSGYFPIEYIALDPATWHLGAEAFDGRVGWANEYSWWSVQIDSEYIGKTKGKTYTSWYNITSMSLKVNGVNKPVDILSDQSAFIPRCLIKAGDKINVDLALDVTGYDEDGVTLSSTPVKESYSYSINFFSLADELGEDFIHPTSAKKSLTSAKATIGSKAWTGKQIKPEPVVKVGSKVLKKDVDYTLGHSANKNIGKGQVTVKGKGAYKGTKVFSFKIVPKTVKIKKLSKKSKAFKTAWIKTNSRQKVQGYQIHYRQKGKIAWKPKTYSVKKTSATIKRLKKGKTYEVRIRSYKKVGNVVYYSKWSATKKIKVK